jgi:outer membrane protein OmpA-like peptidoglycan-associated protein
MAADARPSPPHLRLPRHHRPPRGLHAPFPIIETSAAPPCSPAGSRPAPRPRRATAGCASRRRPTAAPAASASPSASLPATACSPAATATSAAWTAATAGRLQLDATDATPVGAERPLTTRLRATLIARRRTLASPAAQFEIRSARLLKVTRRWLDRLTPTLTGSRSLRCTGHTSGLGDDAANEELGLARAKAVCGYLRGHGVKASYTTASRGETRPRASNRTARGRALNRRVELTVTRR